MVKILSNFAAAWAVTYVALGGFSTTFPIKSIASYQFDRNLGSFAKGEFFHQALVGFTLFIVIYADKEQFALIMRK